MAKIILLIFIFFYSIAPLHAVKLKLRKIYTYAGPYATFKSKYKQDNNSFYNSSYVVFRFSDFNQKNMPLYLSYTLIANEDASLLAKKMGYVSFVDRPQIGSFIRDDSVDKYDSSFKIYFSKKMRFGSTKFSLSGNMKLFTGEVKVFRVKLSQLEKHLNDLNQDGIKIFWQKKNKTQNSLLKVDIGKSPYYSISLDDTSGKVHVDDISIYTSLDGYEVLPEIANSDAVFLSIVYTKNIKSQDIKVNFNVPIKWKSVSFPDKKNVRLEPVKPVRRQSQIDASGETTRKL